MNRRLIRLIGLWFLFLSVFHPIFATVSPGQPLWGVTKRIGDTTDSVDSKVDQLDIDNSQNDSIIDASLDTIESDLTCSAQTVTSADIVSGTITLSTAGIYDLAADLTADIDITTTCVTLNLNERSLTGVIDIAAVDDAWVKNGNVFPPAPTTASPAAGITIGTLSNRVIVSDVVVKCTDTETSTDRPGRDGISIDGIESQVLDCTITAGSAPATATASSVDGGTGIVFSSNAQRVVVQRCTIWATGNGGSITSIGATGGDGGYGVSISGPDNVQILDSIIFSTGAGGAGGAAVSGTGGNGGDGVFIASTSQDVSILNCTIRNTGAGGTGVTTGGQDGKAVNDDVAAGADESIVFGNFSHNIANTINFDLQATGTEQGVSMLNPPTSTALNIYANLYVP